MIFMLLLIHLGYLFGHKLLKTSNLLLTNLILFIMKKKQYLAVYAMLVLTFSCQKDEVSETVSIDNVEVVQGLPHYDDSNTELVNWNNFPEELKNAKQNENNLEESKDYSYQVGPFGGGGGSAFSFNPPTTDKIHAIAIKSGSKVDKIIVYYRKPNGTVYKGIDQGGNGGDYYIHFFQGSEYIKGISGRSGRLLDRISVITNKKSFTHGGNGGSEFNVPIPPTGFQILGFYGRSGRLIDRIGFYIHTL